MFAKELRLKLFNRLSQNGFLSDKEYGFLSDKEYGFRFSGPAKVMLYVITEILFQTLEKHRKVPVIP